MPPAFLLLLLALFCLGGFVVPQPEEPREESEPAPAPPAEATELPRAIVTLRNMQRFEGALLEQSDEAVVLLIGRIPMRITRSQVDSVTLLPSLRERYDQLLRGIGESDHRGRLRLARWLISEGQYAWAREQVDLVLERDPADPEARDLRRLVLQQLALEGRRGGGAAAADRPIPGRPRKEVFPLLNPDEINVLKVYEVDLTNPPRLSVKRDTVEQLLAEYAGDPLIPSTREGREALFRAPADQVLELMFRLRARDLYPQVTVHDHPRPFRLFRDSVHANWLVNSCATDRCHGGAEAGRLRLYNKQPKSDATVYTNFLILERFRTSDGRPLMDYDEPAASTLLHLAIPRADSRYPHPEVPGSGGRDIWRPALPSRNDRRFQRALDWIRAMYKPRPDYPVEYIPPGEAEAGAAAGRDPEPPQPR